MLNISAQGYAAKGSAREWLVRRSASTLSSSKQTKGGVSSFAYQGTNSHATIGALKLIQASLYHSQLTWERQKFWYQVHSPPPDVQDPCGPELCACAPRLGKSCRKHSLPVVAGDGNQDGTP